MPTDNNRAVDAPPALDRWTAAYLANPQIRLPDTMRWNAKTRRVELKPESMGSKIFRYGVGGLALGGAAAGLGVGAAGLLGGAGAAAGGAGAAGAAGAGTTGASIGLGGALGAMPATISTTAGTLGGGAAAGGAGLLARLGGTSGLLRTGGEIASQLGTNMADSRREENAANVLYGNTQARQYETQQQAMLQALMAQSSEQGRNANLDLDQRQFALNAPQTRGRQALLGSLMQNMQPVQMSGLSPQIRSRMPTITGGLTPAAISPQARMMGLLMQQNAVQGQQKGDTFAPPPTTNFMGGLIPPPNTANTYRGSGSAETILGLLGLASNAYRPGST